MRGTASWDHSGILKLLVTAFAILLAPLEVYAQGHDTVWVWSAMCGQPRTIALDVRLDQSLIYHTRLPMCRVERALEIGETIRFSFTPHRPIVWMGYRTDKGDTTNADTPVEGRIWQAGGDPDALLLGVVMSSADGMHMNAIHVVRPGKPSEKDLAAGLFVRTYPVPSGPLAFRSALPSPPRPPLDTSDFTVASVSIYQDSGDVRRRVGAPDSVFVEDNTFGGGSFLKWVYADLRFFFVPTDTGATLLGITLRTSRVATHRGLRVGDPADRVRLLYGKPDIYEDEWRYAYKERHHLIISVTVANRRVTGIYVGSIVD